MQVGRFRRGRFIGSGASGDVHEGVDTSTAAIVAIKSVDCRRFRSIAELEAAQAEAELLGTLRHRYIVRLLDVAFTPRAIHFVMEYANRGTLAQLLDRQKGRRLGEEEAQRIFSHVFQAVEYCHRRCICHRDLKPENVLIDANGDAKVADFGLASLLTPYDGNVCSLVGTPEFMAPDLLVSASCDGKQADCWSLGVMLYEALAGRVPFRGPTLPAILSAALRNECPPLPPEVGEQCRALVAALLRPDPGKRITLEQVMSHPWVRPFVEQGRSLSPLPSFGDSEPAEGEEQAPVGLPAGCGLQAASGAGDSQQEAAGSSQQGSHKAAGRAEPVREGGVARGTRKGHSSQPAAADVSACGHSTSLVLNLPGQDAKQGLPDGSSRLASVAEDVEVTTSSGSGTWARGRGMSQGSAGSSRAALPLLPAGAAAGQRQARRCQSGIDPLHKGRAEQPLPPLTSAARRRPASLPAQ